MKIANQFFYWIAKNTFGLKKHISASQHFSNIKYLLTGTKSPSDGWPGVNCWPRTRLAMAGATNNQPQSLTIAAVYPCCLAWKAF